MSKRHSNPRTIEQAGKVIDYHASEIEEMANDVGKTMMRDQAEWLDAQMKDLLPPDLYATGHAGDPENKVGEYLTKHGIRLIFIPDRMVLRIMIGERVHSQFVPQLLCDGEKVDFENVTKISPDRN